MIGTFFYNLIIMPLSLLFEFIFSVANRLVDSPAYVLFILSIVVNLLCLPLYRRADAIQEKERDKQASMKGWVDHIKKTFSGDERYMMLNTYYRQQDYKPIHALKGSLSLLLQIPFFMAAYRYLSNLTLLKGVSFWFVRDLGVPDQMFQIGDFTVNILPILMTLINVIASYIYLRGFPISQKIQTYALAAFFLVLLYNSPSGLVIYWTCNQIFSLLKNVFLKLVKDRRILGALVSAAGIAVFLALLLTGKLISTKRIAFCIVLLLVCQLPLILAFRKKSPVEKQVPEEKPASRKLTIRLVLLGEIFLTILTGAVIPLSVISSSATEFYTVDVTPGLLVFHCVTTFAGVFLVWFNVFFYLMTPKGKHFFVYLMMALSGAATVGYLLFGRNLGRVSSYLVFDEKPWFSLGEKFVNLIVIAAVIAAMILVIRFLRKYASYLYIVMIVGIIGLLITSTMTIRNTMAAVQKGDPRISSEIPKITFSSSGKNVIVLMLDRSIGAYIPYIFNEKPELNSIFSGFTFYPNTVSFGMSTNYGSPALFGGYEYSVTGMNERSDVDLAVKHNEALRLMPALFGTNEYQVTVVNPPYSGYTWSGDLSIFDGMENVEAFIVKDSYGSEETKAGYAQFSRKQIRNFIYYSVFKCIPEFLQLTIYDEGNYHSTTTNIVCSPSSIFLNHYNILCSLPSVTRVDEDEKGHVLIMDNNTAHEDVILKLPDYTVPDSANVEIMANMERFQMGEKSLEMLYQNDVAGYDTAMAAYLKLGAWFEHLKELGVYDNTRIIIVADHGYPKHEVEELKIDDELDAEGLNPVLMVKDFGASGDFKSDETFMTNADVPAIALQGLVEDPVNPFTGQPIDDSAKTENGAVIVTSAFIWDINVNRGQVFDTSDGYFYSVHGDIYDKNNWTLIGEDY